MIQQFNVPEEIRPNEHPVEMPNQREREENGKSEFKVREVFRDMPEEEVMKNQNPDGKLDVKKGSIVIVSLSGKKNYKAVTNWMRIHMGAYPETFDGFFVRFIDGGREGYVVKTCKDGEGGENIDGVNYEILPYTFELDSEEAIMITESVKHEMFNVLEGKGINVNNGWDVDNERKNKKTE